MNNLIILFHTYLKSNEIDIHEFQSISILIFDEFNLYKSVVNLKKLVCYSN